MDIEVIKIFQTLKELNTPIRIHLGCGGNILEHYINVDQVLPKGVFSLSHTSLTYSIGMDIFEFLGQVPYESVDEIMSTFLIEHIPIERVSVFIGMHFLLLKGGGIVRHEVDDFDEKCKKLRNVDIGKDFNRFVLLNDTLFCTIDVYGNGISSHKSYWNEKILRYWFSKIPGFRIDKIDKTCFDSLVIQATKIEKVQGISVIEENNNG